jgi:hypothetical protein
VYVLADFFHVFLGFFGSSLAAGRSRRVVSEFAGLNSFAVQHIGS